MTDLTWLTQIPASTTQEHAPGPAGAHHLRLVVHLVVGGEDVFHHRRTPTGDAVAGLVEEAARLTAERAALLAPVEGVDLEEVLTATSWCSACDEPVPAEVAATHDACMDCGAPLEQVQALKVGRLARAYVRLRAEYADLLATSDAYQHMHTRAVRAEEAVERLRHVVAQVEALTAEGAAIRAAVGLPADDSAANVIEQMRRRDAALRASRSAHETTIGVSLRLQKMNDDLMATVEEARLILAAEQGKPEGAPSADWTPQGGGWVNERLGRRVQRGVHGWDVFPLWPPFGCLLVAPTARAAMIAAMIVADAATGAR